jgi:hypothetical protein
MVSLLRLHIAWRQLPCKACNGAVILLTDLLPVCRRECVQHLSAWLLQP